MTTMMTPELRRRLALRRRALLRTLLSMEFNLSAREEHLSRSERGSYNRIRDARRNVQASLGRMGSAIIAR